VTEKDVQAIKKIFDHDDSKSLSSKKRGKMKEVEASQILFAKTPVDESYQVIKNGHSEGVPISGLSPNKNNAKSELSRRVHTAANETAEPLSSAHTNVPENATMGNSLVSSLDKQQFRDEFTSIVIKQCERYKKLMDESTFNKHKERCINILYDKELRFFDKEMQRKDSRLDVDHYMNSIRNRVSKFLEDYMKKLVESIKKSKKEKESGGSTSIKREHENEDGQNVRSVVSVLEKNSLDEIFEQFDFAP
ncbi:16613_t:CDS:2, partial [Acaulospora colombiana]